VTKLKFNQVLHTADPTPSRLHTAPTTPFAMRRGYLSLSEVENRLYAPYNSYDQYELAGA